MRNKLKNYFRAAFPCIAIQTTEESRVSADIFAVAKELKQTLYTWSATEGFKDMSTGKIIDDTEDLLAACKMRKKESIFLMRDIQTWPLDRDPVLNRALRDFISDAPKQGSSVVIVAPEFKPHATIERMVTILDYTLPDKNDMRQIIEGLAKSINMEIPASDSVLQALSGLNTTEAENALALSVVETGGFDANVIYREKVLAVKKSGLLEVIESDPKGLDAIGGLDELKMWINKRKKAYSPEAEKFGLVQPKGIMLVGCPGAGKSLASKAIGTALGVPTIKLDVGNLFNSLVGESEARTRDALKLAEAMAPCVLWVDEIDKGLAGAGGSGSGDGGVTRRVFGSIISWMQERKRPVFLVATANQVQGLPPELLRKGRFDELFAVDLPNQVERTEIFKIHLTKKNRDFRKFDLAQLVDATKDFTGSEIETVVNEAMFNAFDSGKDIETFDLVKSAMSIVPLAKTAEEQIKAIRTWAKTRARFASSTDIVQQKPEFERKVKTN